MQVQRSRLRNKLMLGCAAVAAATLAAPGAFARSHDNRGYYGSRGHDYHGWHHHGHGGNALGALIVGAVVGGVVVNALDHSHDYDRYDRTYYAPPPPPAGYSYNDGYGSYENSSTYYDSGDAASTYYSNEYAPTYYAPTYYGDDGN